jgi:UDP-N-acetyl-D-mannosaminuronic acid transferase (WecB/TagA/CpsF family)
MKNPSTAISNLTGEPFRQILGLKFFTGSAAEAVDRMSTGGLLVVPAAPALKDLPLNAGYRQALLDADLTITDSAFMVLIWNFLQRDNIPRTSGLAYLRELLHLEEIRQSGAFWIMAGPKSATLNAMWLRSNGIAVSESDIYIAPLYGEKIDDKNLLGLLRKRRPRHIVLTLGGGTQERLGSYLKNNLDFRPAIHCIGAAIAFLSGDQVRIPYWVDRLYLGWLLRCIAEPRRYVSRYWNARKLLPLMLRYRGNLPPVNMNGQENTFSAEPVRK